MINENDIIEHSQFWKSREELKRAQDELIEVVKIESEYWINKLLNQDKPLN